MAAGTQSQHRDSAAKLPAKTCGTPLPMCGSTFAEVTRRLDTEIRTGLERVVSVADAVAILASMAARSVPCSPADAADAAERLIGVYPAREVNNTALYVQSVTAVLAAYPHDFVRRVVDPVTGLPSRLKFIPTIAEIKAALDAESARRQRIAANARYLVEQDEQRRADAEDRRYWEAERAKRTPEALEKIGQLAASFRANTLAAETVKEVR